MVEIYENMGYHVEHHLVRAVDYGVAQKRKAVIIVGIRNDFSVRYRLPKKYDRQLVLRDVLKNVPVSEGEKYSLKKAAVLDLVPAGGYWRDLPEEIAKDYMGKSYYSGGGRTGMARRISWDEACLTLTCSPRKSKRNAVIQMKQDHLRCESMPGFSFQIPGRLQALLVRNISRSAMLFRLNWQKRLGYPLLMY